MLPTEVLEDVVGELVVEIVLLAAIALDPLPSDSLVAVVPEADDREGSFDGDCTAMKGLRAF